MQSEPVFADDDADARNNSRLGRPTRVAARVATMLANSTSPPASSTRYSCCKVISSRS